MSTPRRDIEELLPFLANGTLQGAERAEVEASVAADPALAQELEALKRVRQQMQSEAFETSPGELGLARLLRDVEREGQTLAPAAETQAPSSGVSVVQLRFWQVASALVAAIAALIPRRRARYNPVGIPTSRPPGIPRPPSQRRGIAPRSSEQRSQSEATWKRRAPMIPALPAAPLPSLMTNLAKLS